MTVAAATTTDTGKSHVVDTTATATTMTETIIAGDDGARAHVLTLTLARAHVPDLIRIPPHPLDPDRAHAHGAEVEAGALADTAGTTREVGTATIHLEGITRMTASIVLTAATMNDLPVIAMIEDIRQSRHHRHTLLDRVARHQALIGSVTEKIKLHRGQIHATRLRGRHHHLKNSMSEGNDHMKTSQPWYRLIH